MNKLYFYISSLAGLILLCLPIQAQRHEIFNPRISTLQVVAGNDWLSLPIIKLNQGEQIHIDFDDMTHDYHRYVYKLEHCDANWNVSQGLFENDYLAGFNGEQAIEDIEQSLNTNHLYTHYHLSLPSENCRLKMSGNYKLTVYDETAEDDKMFTACFMVLEPEMTVGVGYISNTDIDVNRNHQQGTIQADYGFVHVTNPLAQLTTVVLQNGRWDNAVVNAKPDYIQQSGLQWQHCQQLIFQAGNHYRKFEMLDMDHPTMGIDEIKWDGKNYQVFVMPDLPRPNYVYDESAQGAFYIRNSDNEGNDYLSDYAWVHFQLEAPRSREKFTSMATGLTIFSLPPAGWSMTTLPTPIMPLCC